MQSLLAQLEVHPERGLSLDQVKQRQVEFGQNRIETKKPPTWLSIFLRQFKSLLVGLLAMAALVAVLTGDLSDALAILLVLLINSLIGFVTEVRAISSMESLRKMGRTLCRVIREGRQMKISSEDLVPGDILLLEAGDVVTADLRIIESHNLNADESALTGESVPVEKEFKDRIEHVEGISDRTNMLMKGTHITKGVCRAVATSTGMSTELGKIASLTSAAKEEVTPLEKRLDHLGRRLLWLTLVISIFVFLSGLLTGKDPILMVQTAIALAVATVPEGLPIVATIALAKGLWTMARRNALVNKLSAVETLGATSIIVTDKTGTLTENKMTVSEVLTSEDLFSVKWNDHTKRQELHKNNEALSSSEMSADLTRLIEVAGLCNDATFTENSQMGDPMEIALLRLSADVLVNEEVLKKKYPRDSEVPFDAQTKMMATIHHLSGKYLIAVKGAPEAVISQSLSSEKERERWLRQNEALASRGLRVLAMADKETSQKKEEPYKNLRFLGLIGLIDPARKDVPLAIDQCQEAGIRVIMATGDQAGTAVKIGQDIGLPLDTLTPVSGSELEGEWSDSLKKRLEKTSIFSRFSPEQKLRLVGHYQSQGYVVAMTGDGVNDAPALKKADIGVAMGQRGTEVAKEASDMILRDDRFSTIVFAVEQGRVIFSNIRKFVIYLLSCNISEVFVVGIASVFSSQLPIMPLQILFLNLVTDVFPALALGMGKGDHSYLLCPPRGSQEKILEKSHWIFIFVYGSLITATVFGVFSLFTFFIETPFEKVVTLSFLTLGLSQVFHVFNLRKSDSSFVFNEISRNPYVWGAISICLVLFVGSVHLPFAQATLDLVPLTFYEWLTVFGFSLVPLIGQSILRFK